MAERQITLAPILPRWLPRFRMALQTALRANFLFFLPKTQLKMCHISSFTHLWYIFCKPYLFLHSTSPALPPSCIPPSLGTPWSFRIPSISSWCAAQCRAGPCDSALGPVLASDRPVLTLVGPDCRMFFPSLKSRDCISAVPLDHFRRKKALNNTES